MRTLLALPPDDDAALEAGLASGPDGLLVVPEAADGSAALARRPAGLRLVVCLSAADDGPAPEELARLAPIRPDGILLLGCVGRRDIERLGTRLAVHEAEHDLADGALGILASVGSAKGWLALGGFPGSSRRLAGLIWDEAAMRADLGLPPDGPAPVPCLHARAATVLAARAAGVPAIEGPARPGTGTEALVAAVLEARRDGFAGKIASAPAQVAAIARAFVSEPDRK